FNTKATQPLSIVVHNAPTNLERPKLDGTARVGETLSVSEGQWEARTNPLAYQWLRCPTGVADGSEAGCTEVSGATDPTYTAAPKDAGKRLVAKVVASNASHRTEAALSAPSEPVAKRPGEGGPPQTKLAKHPHRKTAQRKARFTFTSDQPGSS